MKLVLILSTLALTACDSSDGPVFIALQSDFVGFRNWAATDLGDAPLQGHPAGERTAFVKTPISNTDTAYPLGDIIIKTVAVDPTDETKWDLFGMVKRGGGYNSGGARNWEFFLMKIPTQGGDPQISARGSDPTDSPSARAGYFDANGQSLPCNMCHGAPGTDKTDFVLAPPLEPGHIGDDAGVIGDGGP